MIILKKDGKEIHKGKVLEIFKKIKEIGDTIGLEIYQNGKKLNFDFNKLGLKVEVSKIEADEPIDEKAEVMAQLDELGIAYRKNMKLETLKSKLKIR